MKPFKVNSLLMALLVGELREAHLKYQGIKGSSFKKIKIRKGKPSVKCGCNLIGK